jgi:hypothetical protein
VIVVSEGSIASIIAINSVSWNQTTAEDASAWIAVSLFRTFHVTIITTKLNRGWQWPVAGGMKLIGVILLVIVATIAVLFTITFIQTASELEHFRADCRQLSENRFSGETAWHCNDDITYLKDRNGQIISRVGSRNSRPKY